MGTPFLDGERLYLRALEDGDADGPYVTWFNDEDVCRGNSHHRYPYTRDSALSYIHHAREARDELILGIVLREGNTHIGNIALQCIDPVYRCAELSIVIGNKEAWGSGYSREACRLLCTHGFLSLNLNRIACATLDSNEPMKRLALSLGMKEEGRRRSAAYKSGHYLDIVEFGILRVEYLANQASLESGQQRGQIIRPTLVP